MLKLYNHNETGQIEYHEAWVNGDEVTVHWGIVGEQGQSKAYLKSQSMSEDDALREALQEAVNNGFRPLDEGSWRFLIIEYQLGTWGEGSDLDKRHQIEDRMNETLGWCGLGHCDGGSIGSGTMEVCCVVADFQIAKRVIEEDLKDTEYDDFSRIYDEGTVEG